MPRGKVITTLHHRREIEAVLDALSRARTEEESHVQLAALAAYGSAVLPVALQFLDTPDPWMVRALGRLLAQIKDRQRAVDALRRAVLDEQSSDRRRIVGMVLLDQFLGQTLDESLFTALGNPTEVAVRALLRQPPVDEPTVRLDYLSIIHAQPVADILHSLERFREEASPAAVDALRFFALDEREHVAAQALQALGMVRRPEALQALRILEPNVPSYRRPLAVRMQHKLLLSGVPDVPLPEPPAGARVLVSPIDGAGNRLLLFLAPEEGGYRVLHVFLDDDLGARGAYEVSYAAGTLPEREPLGTVYPAPHPWEGIFVQEAAWGYARRIVRNYLAYNEAREGFLPLEYCFYCDRIWRWDVAEEESPELPILHEDLSQVTLSSLLGHPYMVSWFLESDEVARVARGLLKADLSVADGQGMLALATVSLIQSEFPAQTCLRYARRLRDTAEWLLRAGEKGMAAVAAAAAEEMDAALPLGSLFALMLVQKGLLVSLGSLRQGDG